MVQNPLQLVEDIEELFKLLRRSWFFLLGLIARDCCAGCDCGCGCAGGGFAGFGDCLLALDLNIVHLNSLIFFIS